MSNPTPTPPVDPVPTPPPTPTPTPEPTPAPPNTDDAGMVATAVNGLGEVVKGLQAAVTAIPEQVANLVNVSGPTPEPPPTPDAPKDEPDVKPTADGPKADEPEKVGGVKGWWYG